MAKKLILTIVAVIGIMAMVLPGCTGGGPELPSTYIGSGALDGNGIPVDFFSDIHVRKAFCYAFDYDIYIEEALSGQGVQRGSPVVEGLYGYDPAAPMYEYDLDEAVAEMKLAWDGEAWEKGFKFTLLYNAGNLPRKTACEMVSEKWAYIGANDEDIADGEHFQVSIQALAWPTILGKIFGTRDMPMFQIGWLPDYPHADNFIVPFMHSQGTFSYFQGYGDSALDAQITAAFQDTNPTTQMAKYAALQQRYYDDAPGIVLAQPLARRYFTAHVTGFYYNPCETAYPGTVYNLTKADNGGDVPYKNDGKLIQMTIGDAESLDPAWMYDNASGEQARYDYETLLYYDGNSTEDFVPVLATNWTFVSDDNTLHFTIRTGVQFHSGHTLTPADVEYSFKRAMCQDRPGGPIWMFYQALLGEDVWGYEDTTFAAINASVEVDGQDVVFYLSGAYWEIPFKQVLCGAWASIVEKQWCIDQGDWDGTESGVAAVLHPQEPGDTALFDKVNGTGPWKLSDWDQGVQIVHEKNASYWGGSVPFDWVYYKIVEEWSTRKSALLAGDADIVYVPATNFDEMDSEGGLNVFYDLPSLSIDAFFFNMIIGGPAE
jgi:ABC-type transport system substrate-binding protein